MALSCCTSKVTPASDSTEPIIMMATNNEQLELTNSSILESVTSNVSNILESPVPDGITATPDDYMILQSIGVGYYGTANILLARHKPTRLVLVIRQIDLEALNNDKLEEVEHEMQLSNMLIHPNVASYYCSFVSGPMLWAVQSLMHYGSCADLMHSAKQFNNGFSENVIAIILRDVVKGLHYLHSLGFVHRSIRAKHFLIHESGVVKVSGIRNLVPMISEGTKKKALHGHFSAAGDNICWLAPEILAQDLCGYNYKSDIYSIGITALELATGEAPFAGLPLTEIMMLKLKGHPPMLLRRQDNNDPTMNFSKTFFKVVDMCVFSNPHHRPSASKLLSLSFLKSSRRKGPGPSSLLKDLLLPVVPLNPDSLNPLPHTSSADKLIEKPSSTTLPIDPPFNALTLDEPWLI